MLYIINSHFNTFKFDNIIDLGKLANVLPNFIYEPEKFPGLICKRRGRPTCLIFSSGKVVIAGAKSEHIVEKTANEVHKILKRL